jgi:hypothetical protein
VEADVFELAAWYLTVNVAIIAAKDLIRFGGHIICFWQ